LSSVKGLLNSLFGLNRMVNGRDEFFRKLYFVLSGCLPVEDSAMGSTSREPANHVGSQFIRWDNRAATRLSNGIVELVVLTSGGHLAEFRFLEQEGRVSPNAFWKAPWITFDSNETAGKDLPATYGPVEVRKFLVSFTGHCLCLDYFGGPSAEQAAAGLSLHGEAPNATWNVLSPAPSGEVLARWQVELPTAHLSFEREIRLGVAESIAYVRETVTNQGAAEHSFDWVQHVTFGPPLLKEGESTVSASGNCGITWPASYDGGSMLENDCTFTWPHAPLAGGKGFADLRRPFAEKGLGFIAGMQLDPRRKQEYLLAVNWKDRLGIGYCFRRADFPYMTLWEENYSRLDPPWNGRTQARGMEFGTTPLPLGSHETVRRGPLFGTPQRCVIPAGGQKTAHYIIFLCNLPTAIDSITNVEATGDVIVLYDGSGRPSMSLSAGGCGDFLA
jgi:hypothetical protein